MNRESTLQTKSKDTARFSYRALKTGALQILQRGSVVKTLTGASASKLQDRLDGADPDDIQLLLAKASGQFRFGNERLSKPGAQSE